MIAVGGALVALGWWLVMVPMLEVSGTNWNKDRSPHAFWKLKQRCLKLGWWQHDDGFVVGRLGGKEWMEPLIKAVGRGEGLSCSGGHRGSALSFITNRALPAGADPKVDWPKWWAANKDRSQEDWILDGFREAGIDVSKPAAKEQFPRLLSVLGETCPPADEWEKTHPRMARPDYLRYNAFRWLRDSGFDPVRFLLESDPSKLDVAPKNGLAEYQRELCWLEVGPVARLAFAVEDGDDPFVFLRDKLPAGLQPRMHLIMTGAAMIFLLAGLAVIWLTKRFMAARPSSAPAGES